MIARALAAALALGLLLTARADAADALDRLMRPLNLTGLPGARATDFSLPSVGGGKVSLAEQQGKVVLVYFWATWCPYCRRELPAGIEQVTRERRGQPFTVLAVSIEEPKDLVASWVKGAGVTLPVLLDYDGAVARDYRVHRHADHVRDRARRAPGGAGRGQPRVGRPGRPRPARRPGRRAREVASGPLPPMATESPIDSLDTDILILGAGGAGLCAALHAADALPDLDDHGGGQGPARPRRLHAHGAGRLQRGARARPTPSSAHLLDTLHGGGWINDQELVWTLVNEAPGRVLELEARYGCFFDRHPDGRSTRSRSRARRHDRTIHKGDLTGIEIMNRLTEQVWRGRPSGASRSTARSSCCATTAAQRGGRAPARHPPRRASCVVASRAILLAMGGGPTMYKVIACSADKSSDGIALGLRAGVRAARHGDGAVPSDRAHRAQLAHDRRAARGGAARGGRPPAQRPRRAVHAALRRRRAWSAPRATWSRARASSRCMRGPRHAERRGVDRRLAPGRRGGGAELPRHGRALPRLRPRPGPRAGRGRARPRTS